ncbi:hypothetical protein MSG28_011251 [Choristoneura fumiferana]|uniref:Uncharacterized protein n=1 Tax=Choristoneura fumiferana TaxID=7141 RepID=A0ACC0KRN9_CHOFU|nr:hypothetical protein MSG28_011251 [Choristoneura fumiferana]
MNTLLTRADKVSCMQAAPVPIQIGWLPSEEYTKAVEAEMAAEAAKKKDDKGDKATWMAARPRLNEERKGCGAGAGLHELNAPRAPAPTILHLAVDSDGCTSARAGSVRSACRVSRIDPGPLGSPSALPAPGSDTFI